MDLKDHLKDNQPIVINTDIVTSICVIAAIQLACRHPSYIGTSRSIAERFARKVQANVSQVVPSVAVIMEMGWDPQYDE